MTTLELMEKLREHYDGRKVYYQKWNNDSIRVAFRKYKDPIKQYKETVRYYKHLISGKIFPISVFKKIWLICSRARWFIELELAEEGWVESEMKRCGYFHPSEVLPDIGIYKNGGEIQEDMVLDANIIKTKPDEQWWENMTPQTEIVEKYMNG